MSRAVSMSVLVLLVVFHPGKKDKTGHNYYTVNNSKTVHFSASCLSITRPTKIGIMVAIIPTINIQYFKFEGFAN